MRHLLLIALVPIGLFACSDSLPPPNPNADLSATQDTVDVGVDASIADQFTVDLQTVDHTVADSTQDAARDAPPDATPIDAPSIDKSAPLDLPNIDAPPAGDLYADQTRDLPPPDLLAPDLAPAVDSYIPPTWKVTVSPTTQHLYAVRKIADKWIAVGAVGTVLLRQPTGWATAVNGNQWTIKDIWPIDDNTVLLASNGGVLRYNWTSFTVDPVVPSSSGIWGSSPSDIWSVANYNTHHLLGGNWTYYAGSYSAVSIYGKAANDIWSWGDGKVYHYDGSAWQSVFFTLKLTGMWGPSAAELWATKESPGGMHHYMNGGWIDYPIGGLTQDLNAIAGTSATNIYAVGDNGTMLHYNGTAWSFLPIITNKDLFAVHAADDGTVVIVGEGGTLIEYR